MIFKGAGFDSSSLRPVSPSNRSILETTIQPLNPTIKNQLEDTNGDYVYDAAGNLTQPGPIGGPYVYDAENHLISADGVTYTYDGDGNRVMKSNGTIYWYGANSASLEESDLSGNLQRWYYFFDGQRVGRSLTTNEVGFYMTDALGSVRYLGGSATGYRFDYFPFGAPILDSDTGDDRYQFTGKERDSESGLDNFGARFNSSSIGRFMSPDWSDSPEPVPYADITNPQSLNLYSYVKNNPITFDDPDGHCIGPVIFVVCAVVVGVSAAAYGVYKLHQWFKKGLKTESDAFQKSYDCAINGAICTEEEIRAYDKARLNTYGDGAVQAITNTLPGATPSTEIKDVVIDELKDRAADKMVDSAKEKAAENEDNKKAPLPGHPDKPGPPKEPDNLPPKVQQPVPPPCAVGVEKSCPI